MKKILEYEGEIVEIRHEDGSMAMIAEVTDNSEKENGLFFRIQSWDARISNPLQHDDFNKLKLAVGQKLMVERT